MLDSSAMAPMAIVSAGDCIQALIPTTDREEMRVKELRERMQSLSLTGIFRLSLCFSLLLLDAIGQVSMCTFVPVFARLVTRLWLKAAAVPSLQLVHCLVP